MKIKKIAIAAAVTLALLTTVGVFASAAGYDSSTDPIVTLSYLTTQFKNEILEEVDKKIAAVSDSLSSLRSTDQTPAQTLAAEPVINTNASSAQSTAYEVVELTYGDTLYAADACELILRAGEAVCIAPDASQGLADVTNGYEIYNGQALTKNHLCLIPRADGRGIMAASESVFIMVSGDYTLGN